MLIKENDIFNFVFSKEKLDEFTKEEIANNNDLLSILSFYKTLKSELLSDVKLSEKIKLSNLIPDYNLEDDIILKPIKLPYEPEISINMQNENNKDSEAQIHIFQDEEKNFLIKTYNEGLSNALVFFTNTEIKLSNMLIELFPQKAKFQIKSLAEPINIGEITDISEIHLEFNAI